MVRVALVSLLAVLVFAAVPAAGFSPPYEEYRESGINGTVCVLNTYMHEGSNDGCYGQGIPNATVHLVGNGIDQTVQSNLYGGFSFPGAPEGTYTLSASRAGFDAADVKVEAYMRHDISLRPQKVTVTGQVQDAFGAPVEGASVSFCCSTVEGSIAAVTDASGNFSGSYYAGEYTAQVNAAGYTIFEGQVFLDGATVAFTLHKMPPQDVLLSGYVIDQQGHGVEEALVVVDQYRCCMGAAPGAIFVCNEACPPGAENGLRVDSFNSTRTDADGHYAIRVYAGGEANIRVEHADVLPYADASWVPATSNHQVDVHVVRIPGHTVHVTGRVVDAVTGTRVAEYSVNAQQLQFQRWECSDRPYRDYQYRDRPYPTLPPYAPYGSPYPDYASPHASPGYYVSEPTFGDMRVSYAERIENSPGHSGCAIHVLPDGTFEGDLMPGFTHIRVDAPQQCVETQDAGGGFRRACGPEYLPFVVSMVLEEGNETEIVVRLQPRPAPDAVLSGYLVDAGTDQALPFGHIAFNNEVVPGYGYATTDGDGSFAVRLRSGYHTVTVTVNGYFEWQGTVLVEPGDNAFDVELTRGQVEGSWYPGMDRNGHGLEPSPHDPAIFEHGCGFCGPPAPTVVSVPMPVQSVVEGVEVPASATEYVDLGGNLGPYDPVAREAALEPQAEAQGAPGLALGALVAAMTVAVLLGRRR